MEAIARYADGVQFEVVARGHRVICDQPPDHGGQDQGMTPPEFLLAALASCAGYYAVQYLKARGLPTEDLHVRATAEKAGRPMRLTSFRLEVEAPVLDAGQEAGLLRAVRSCLIHNTLAEASEVDVALIQPAVV